MTPTHATPPATHAGIAKAWTFLSGLLVLGSASAAGFATGSFDAGLEILGVSAPETPGPELSAQLDAKLETNTELLYEVNGLLGSVNGIQAQGSAMMGQVPSLTGTVQAQVSSNAQDVMFTAESLAYDLQAQADALREAQMKLEASAKASPAEAEATLAEVSQLHGEIQAEFTGIEGQLDTIVDGASQIEWILSSQRASIDATVYAELGEAQAQLEYYVGQVQGFAYETFGSIQNVKASGSVTGTFSGTPVGSVTGSIDADPSSVSGVVGGALP